MTRLVLILLIFFLPPRVGLADGLLTLEETIRKVEKDHGAIIQQNLFPALSQDINTIFDRLSEAMVRAKNLSYIQTHDLFFLDSDKPEIGIERISSPGVNQIRSAVFVTTSYLKKLKSLSASSDAANPGNQNTRVGRVLAGALAQRLSRSFDLMDANSLQKANPGENSSFLLDIRADVEAVLLLKTAGFSPACLYEALKMEALDQEEWDDGGNKIKSRDGQPTLGATKRVARLSTQRFIQVLDRYYRGQSPITRHPLVSGIGLGQIDSLPLTHHKKGDVFDIPLFSSLEEAIRALDEIRRLPESVEVKRKGILFQALVLKIDDWLFEHHKEISSDPRQFELFLEYCRKLADTKTYNPDLYNQRKINETFSHYPRDTGLNSHPTHVKALRENPLYQSRGYQDWVKSLYSNTMRGFEINDKGFEPYKANIPKLRRILPDKLLFELFDGEILEIVEKGVRHDSTHAFTYTTLEEPVYRYESRYGSRSSMEDFDMSFNLRLAQLLHQKLVDKLSPLDRIRLARARHNDKPWALNKMLILGFQEDGRYSYQRHQKRLEAFISHPENVDLKESLKIIAASIWRHRGEFAIADMLSSDAMYHRPQTDWRFVMDILGINHTEGRKALNDAVIQFAQEPDYPLLLGKTKLEKIDYNWNDGIKWWFDIDRIDYLTGSQNPHLAKDPLLMKHARALFGYAVIWHHHPQKLAKTYRGNLIKNLDAEKDLNFENVLKILMKTTLDLFGTENHGSLPAAALARAVAEVIRDSAKLNTQQKKELINRLFVHKEEDWRKIYKLEMGMHEWYEAREGWKVGQENAKKRRQTERDIVAIWKLIKSMNPELTFAELYSRLYTGATYTDGYISDISLLLPLIEEEMATFTHEKDKNKKLHLLLRFSRGVFNPPNVSKGNPTKRWTPMGQTAVWGAKSFLGANSKNWNTFRSRHFSSLDPREFEGMGKTAAEALMTMYFNITEWESGTDTDMFFDKIVAFLKRESPQSLPRFKHQALHENRLVDQDKALALFRELYEHRLNELARTEVTDNSLADFVDPLNHLVQGISPRKDQYLEAIAWGLKIRKIPQLKFLESFKTTNWRRANPIVGQFGSAYLHAAALLPLEMREELLHYLAGDGPGELSEKLLQAIDQVFLKYYGKDNFWVYTGPGMSPRYNTYYATLRFKQLIRRIRNNLSPFERIGIYELLLNVNEQDSLTSKKGFIDYFLEKFLNYPKGSMNAILVKTAMEVIPEHERTFVLSYLLSASRGKGSSARPIFEAFQAVGIKAGQLASIWNLFGDETSRDLAQLKDRAVKMTKLELEEHLREELSHEEFSRIIDVVEILGSASIKNAVLVKIKDGDQEKFAVVMVKRPHAEELIKANVEFGKRYIEALAKNGYQIQSRFASSLLDALETQFHDELDFQKEAENHRQAIIFYEQLTREMASQLNGWKLEVPKLVETVGVKKNTFMVYQAKGVSFDKISTENRSVVGNIIGESKLRLLFRKGWFNPDPHAGNFLIDEKTKTIYAIDFGQAVRLSSKTLGEGELEKFSLFAKALGEGNVEDIVSYGAKLSKEGSVTNGQKSSLHQVIATLLSKTASSDIRHTVIEVVTALADGGITLKDKFIWTMKGLMIVLGEKYLSPEEFTSKMRQEIKGRIQHHPWLLTKTLYQNCTSWYRGLE